MARCNFCDEPIIWAKTPDNKRLPLNARPTDRGNAWFDNGVVRISSAEHPIPDGVRRFVPHFIGCEPYKAKKALEAKLKRKETGK